MQNELWVLKVIGQFPVLSYGTTLVCVMTRLEYFAKIQTDFNSRDAFRVVNSGRIFTNMQSTEASFLRATIHRE